MKIFLTGGSGFIGTNMVLSLVQNGHEVRNYDWSKPVCPEHLDYWIQGDLMDVDELKAAMLAFSPDWVIHLAARTDCDESATVEVGYRVNTKGTANLLEAVKACPSVERLIVTSTQYVCGPGRQPNNDEDYFPHTVYGWSKVEAERLTRSADLHCTWTVIRPVNIWGAYHARYGDEFWKIAAAGLYLHPNVPAPTRTYGYIGNVVWQIMGLLKAPSKDVGGKVF